MFQRRAARIGSWCQTGRTLDYPSVDCPVCEQVCKDAVWLSQNMLLAERADMDDIANAVEKIHRAWG